jgi:hypothetical protein
MNNQELIKPYLHGPAIPNLAGQRFSRLVVVEYAYSKSGGAYWHCVCDCGKKKAVPGRFLRSGDTSSCGCLRIERAAIATAKAKTTHGHSSNRNKTRRSRTYSIWTNMHTRCSNEKSGKWMHYGGRGISVCERWRQFECFLADMGECPPGLELERLNVDGNYEPSNCSWVDRKTQCNNRRNNNWLSIGGLRLTVAQWGERPGAVPARLIYSRLVRNWAPERAVFAPIGSRGASA